MNQVDFTRIPSFYHKYIQQVPETDLLSALSNHGQNLQFYLKSLPAEKWEYRYAEGKWTIKDVVQHIIDAERIFSYRALTFARKDQKELPSFDENDYAVNAEAFHRTPEELSEELAIVQKGSFLLFKSFTNDQLEASGIANKNSIYVKAIGFIIVGHALHHFNILKERY